MQTDSPPQSQLGCLWRDESLRLSDEIYTLSQRLMMDWPILDHEIDTWTQRLISLLRLSPPAAGAPSSAAQGD
jgi:hypothetical protein